MLQNLFRNMGPVVKNILLINVVLMVANFIFLRTGTDLNDILGAYYWESESFSPYQILTHMFMHDNRGLMHIIFNMFALVMFGSQLERIWGAKKFLIYYVVCGFGAYILHNFVTMIEVQQALSLLSDTDIAAYKDTGVVYKRIAIAAQEPLWHAENTSMVGASGAVFGLLAGYAYHFPNTKLMLLFPPIPIKAKFFVLGYAALELYSGFQNAEGDSVAHFAHIGGALVGFIMLLIWNKGKFKFN